MNPEIIGNHVHAIRPADQRRVTLLAICCAVTSIGVRSGLRCNSVTPAGNGVRHRGRLLGRDFPLSPCFLAVPATAVRLTLDWGPLAPSHPLGFEVVPDRVTSEVMTVSLAAGDRNRIVRGAALTAAASSGWYTAAIEETYSSRNLQQWGLTGIRAEVVGKPTHYSGNDIPAAANAALADAQLPSQMCEVEPLPIRTAPRPVTKDMV